MMSEGASRNGERQLTLRDLCRGNDSKKRGRGLWLIEPRHRESLGDAFGGQRRRQDDPMQRRFEDGATPQLKGVSDVDEQGVVYYARVEPILAVERFGRGEDLETFTAV